jgi:hypothetical protein
VSVVLSKRPAKKSSTKIEPAAWLLGAICLVSGDAEQPGCSSHDRRPSGDLAMFGTTRLLALTLLFAAGFVSAQAQEKTDKPAEAPDLKKQIDDAIKDLEKIDPGVPGNSPDMIRRRLEDIRREIGRQPGAFGPGFGGGFGRGLQSMPRLGVALQRPPQVLIDQLDLPPGKGLVIADVHPDSAAAKAGVKRSDILVELAGKSVSSDINDFYRDLRDIKPDTEIDATVIRRGQKETIKGLKLSEGRNGPQIFNGPAIQIGPGGAGGFAAGRVQANGNEAVRVQVDNDNFTIEVATGNLKATVKGKREGGENKISDIRINDGTNDIQAGNLAAVPERYRPLIQRMLEGVK